MKIILDPDSRENEMENCRNILVVFFFHQIMKFRFGDLKSTFKIKHFLKKNTSATTLNKTFSIKRRILNLFSFKPLYLS